MPYTVAHAAVAWPMSRRAVLTGAVVAGALAPDVGYYLPRGAASWYPTPQLTHSLLGVLTIDLLAAAVLYGVWRTTVRRPALALLPETWRTEATRDSERGPDLGRVAGWALLVGSLLIGVVSHWLLDLVTHEASVPVGVTNVLGIDASGTYRWTWLQWVLSLVGLALLGAWAWRWGSRVRRGHRRVLHGADAWGRGARACWALLLAAAVVGAVLLADQWMPRDGATSLAIAMTLGATKGVVLAALVLVPGWWWRHWRSSPSPTAGLWPPVPGSGPPRPGTPEG